MIKYMVTLAFCIVSVSAFAQEKLLTIEDALINNRTTLAPANLKQLQFIKGTNDYVYIKT